jgi:Sec-independent protein translocase protein TatA
VLLLVVWIVVVVLAAVVLGGIGFGVVGAAARLRREIEGAERDLRPLLADVQATLEAVERRGRQHSDAR